MLNIYNKMIEQNILHLRKLNNKDNAQKNKVYTVYTVGWNRY